MQSCTLRLTSAILCALSGCAGMGNSRSHNLGLTADAVCKDSYKAAVAQGVVAQGVVAQGGAAQADVGQGHSEALAQSAAGDGQLEAAAACMATVRLAACAPAEDVSRTQELGPVAGGSVTGDGTSSVRAYTLEQLEAIALANNPALLAAQAATRKAAGLREQVGLRPNPLLGYFGQQIADRQTDQHGVFIEQEFVRGNKLELNRQVYSHTQQAQAAENETQLFRILTDVRVRFYEAVAAQQQLDAILSFAKVAERGVQVAADRQQAEEGTLIETLQARTLLSQVSLAARQAQFAYQGAWQDLAAIAGLPATTPVRLVADLESPMETPDWEAAYAQIVAQSPELAAAEALVCEKRALLRRQQAQPIPNVTTQFGVGYDDGTEHGMINVQLAAPIPVWNDNRGNISAAYQDYVRAVQNVQRLKQSIRARLARAVQELDSSMAAVRRFEEEIIPQTEQSLELSEQAYLAGELDFLQVLIVRQQYYESSVKLIAAKGELAQATARIDGLLLTGGLDAPADYTAGDGIRSASFGGQ